MGGGEPGARVGRGHPCCGGRQRGLRRGGAAGLKESIALLRSRVSLAAASRVAVARGFVAVGVRSACEAVLADGLAQKGTASRARLAPDGPNRNTAEAVGQRLPKVCLRRPKIDECIGRRARQTFWRVTGYLIL